MPYYTLTSGSYSDYQIRATLLGPENANLEEMLSDWVDHGPFAPGVEEMEAFIAYIGKLPGWQELFPTEFSLGPYDLKGWQECMNKNQGKWSPKPEQTLEPCPKWPYANIPRYNNYAPRHSWDQGRDDQGRYFWGCSFCGKEAPHGQET